MSMATTHASEHALQPLPRPDPRLHNSRVKINQGILKSVTHLNYDTLKLVVKCDADSVPMGGEAGQYATLHTPGLNKPRSYSFARPPEDEDENEHTFFVRIVHGGEFSGWLAERDRTGTPMTISGPLGKFRLDSTSRPMVCIAGGSGMSAIKALLGHAANLKVERDCLFLYGGRAQRDLYGTEEIAAIGRNWNKDYKFKYIKVLSDEPENTGWAGARGFVTEHFKKAYLDSGKMNVNDCKAYFCGPPPMIDAGVEVLKKAGMSEKDIYFDKFEDARSPAPVIDNTKCVLCDECLMVKPTADCIVEVSKLVKGENGSFESYERVDPAYTSGLYYNTLFIDEKQCIRCYACVDACPTKAIAPNNSKTPRTLRCTVSETTLVDW
jgi:NAD(P)H-flavin reductase